jgi:hypothetical protein
MSDINEEVESNDNALLAAVQKIGDYVVETLRAELKAVDEKVNALDGIVRDQILAAAYEVGREYDIQDTKAKWGTKLEPLIPAIKSLAGRDDIDPYANIVDAGLKDEEVELSIEQIIEKAKAIASVLPADSEVVVTTDSAGEVESVVVETEGQPGEDITEAINNDVEVENEVENEVSDEEVEPDEDDVKSFAKWSHK